MPDTPHADIFDESLIPSGQRPQSRDVFSVSGLTRQARVLLEERLGEVRVEGELSNFRRPGSGHWYFTLKDDAAQIRCAMFGGRNRHVRLAVADGLQVLVQGRVSLYEPRGDFQLIVDAMEPAGEGALRAAFERLKSRLAEEGLFDEARKRQLPRWPRHLTIISSPSGAALRDVLHVIERRFPALKVTLIPAAVQGERAEQQVIAALARTRTLDTDAVLLTRGGGSLEDLWTFNLETVARAIVDCPHPVVSAVGHQTDFTIADFAADVRAPTPSAGAEIITPSREEVAALIGQQARGLKRAFDQELRYRTQHLAHQRARLVDPRQRLIALMQRADDLDARLQRAWHQRRLLIDRRLQGARQSLYLLQPARRIEALQRTVRAGYHSLQQSLTRLLQEQRILLAGQARALQAVSPLPTLERGYTVLTHRDRTPVTSIRHVSPGDRLDAHLIDGTLDIEVRTVDPTRRLIAGDPEDLKDRKTAE